jgi:hypothetical protein
MSDIKRRLSRRPPVAQIETLADCLALSSWAAGAVLRGWIERGVADAAIRAAREWRQTHYAAAKLERLRAVEARLAELEAGKRP